MRHEAPTRFGGKIGLAGAAILALAACAAPSKRIPGERLVLTPETFAALPGWAEDQQAAAVPAVARSCLRLSKAPPEQPLALSGIGGTARDWRAACAGLAKLPAGDDAAARRYFETWFVPYRVAGGAGRKAVDSGKFTGYYEIELKGARHKSAAYRTPVYGPPPDLRGAGGTYASRAEIEHESGDWAARSGAPVLFWAADPVDAFFLHVQGSGRVELAEGGGMRVGYAADNGHDFVAIGRLMLDRGLLPQSGASAQGVRAWLRANPAEARALMAENPRYIFFRRITGPGPIGAEGVPLTAGRSLAVDRAFLPLGAPVWLDTFWPGDTERPLRRLMVAQDAGNAIRGPVRGDIFWGSGEAALEHAGRMNQPGRYYLLLPRRAGAS